MFYGCDKCIQRESFSYLIWEPQAVAQVTFNSFHWGFILSGQVITFKSLNFEAMLIEVIYAAWLYIHLRYLNVLKCEIVELLLNLKRPWQILQKTWHVAFLPEDQVPGTLDWEATLPNLLGSTWWVGSLKTRIWPHSCRRKSAIH